MIQSLGGQGVDAESAAPVSDPDRLLAGARDDLAAESAEDTIRQPYRAPDGGRIVGSRRHALKEGVLMARSARVVLVVLTMLLLAPATTASADAPKFKGAVGDARGDASPGFGTGARPDVKRVSITYHPAAGVIEWRIAMWSPAPSFFMLKAVNATVDCTPASPGVFNLERAAAFPLRVTGIGAVQNVVFERVIDGAHMTETWSGAELRKLDFGCIQFPSGSLGGVVATAVNAGGNDVFDPFEVRRTGPGD